MVHFCVTRGILSLDNNLDYFSGIIDVLNVITGLLYLIFIEYYIFKMSTRRNTKN